MTQEGGATIEESELLDTSKPILHVKNGGIDEKILREVPHKSLDGNYIAVRDGMIQEMRETTGNTETSTGTASGVTAASAIAALQEASGKGSRDSTRASYCSYTQIVKLCIELIRQFYDVPRKFRILGENGSQNYVVYSNRGLKAQSQGMAFGNDMGMRRPEFDIRVSAQKKTVYTRVSQNELALQFFKMGFFNPNLTDQALMCLDMMDFDGKDTMIRKVSQVGGMFQMLQKYMPLAMMAAQTMNPMLAQQIAMDMQRMGIAASLPAGTHGAAATSTALPESDNISGIKPKEHGVVRNARERSLQASQPGTGRVISNQEGKK
jgi:hypothetical protein